MKVTSQTRSSSPFGAQLSGFWTVVANHSSPVLTSSSSAISQRNWTLLGLVTVFSPSKTTRAVIGWSSVAGAW